MNSTNRRLHELFEEYKAGLLLIGLIFGLGLLIGPPPGGPKEAVNHVYSLAAQPLSCGPERMPPTR
jgi:hypothetical protein